jgi:sugar phosphate isomerase/epimerase
MNEGVSAAFEIMKDRIRSTHVHENDGKTDDHLRPSPGAGGSLDWKQVMTLLRTRPDQYPLMLELRDSPERPIPLEEVRRVFDELERL